MAKALGLTPEEAYQTNTDQLAKYLNGNVGLLFTNRDPDAIIAYFQKLSKIDFARAGTVATRQFTIPAGVVMSRGGEIADEDDITMAHSIEPELRKLGVPTSLVKGKIILQNDYTVCKAGALLDSRQTRILKLFGVAMAEFTVALKAYWSSSSGAIKNVNT